MNSRPFPGSPPGPVRPWNPSTLPTLSTDPRSPGLPLPWTVRRGTVDTVRRATVPESVGVLPPPTRNVGKTPSAVTSSLSSTGRSSVCLPPSPVPVGEDETGGDPVVVSSGSRVGKGDDSVLGSVPKTAVVDATGETRSQTGVPGPTPDSHGRTRPAAGSSGQPQHAVDEVLDRHLEQDLPAHDVPVTLLDQPLEVPPGPDGSSHQRVHGLLPTPTVPRVTTPSGCDCV